MEVNESSFSAAVKKRTSKKFAEIETDIDRNLRVCSFEYGGSRYRITSGSESKTHNGSRS